MNALAPALSPTRFVDADHPRVIAFVRRHMRGDEDIARAVSLAQAVRDAIHYDLRSFALDEDLFVASNALAQSSSVCVPKAVALAAVARAAGIPARISFADVRNHLTSPRIAGLMDDDVFRWHAYTVLFLHGRWVKATPAFDRSLCERHGVEPLDFDGRTDSIFQPFDRAGRQHMEYLAFRGEYDDMPFEAFRTTMKAHYSRLLAGLAEDRERLRRQIHLPSKDER